MSFKSIAVLLPATLILAVVGCGYHVGSISNPQVKSIAISSVTNETMEPNLNAMMRQELVESYQRDGALSVKRQGTADCLFQGRIMEVKTYAQNKVTTNDDVNFRTSVFRVTVKFEFVVVIPGRGKPFIPARQVVGEAEYTVLTDEFIARQSGLKQACYDAARQAVVYTTEAW